MKTLDRYLVRQLIPVWIWCILVFVFVSCLIDLFEHLDEILRFHIPAKVVARYYLNFMPMVFVRACPLALLLSAAFVATRLVRFQELLAMNAGGVSLRRASVPFIFVGWLVSLLVFGFNELVVPRTTATFERLRLDTFQGGHQQGQNKENVTTMDRNNRLYHARLFNYKQQELSDLTILEQDEHNRPTNALYAKRAVYTPHGWLLLYGTITTLGPDGMLLGEPRPFVDRLLELPVTPKSFRDQETQPETLRIGQLRRLIAQLRAVGITNVRRHIVELDSKVAFPLMNLVMCLIAFVGSTRRQNRGHLRGLGTSLGWGMLYYIGVAIGEGIGKEGFLPALLAVWLPHVIAAWCCLQALR